MKPVNPTTENRKFLKPVSFTSVAICFQTKTMATLVNYTCKSFIKLAPDKFKAPSTRIRVKKNVRIRRVDVAKAY